MMSILKKTRKADLIELCEDLGLEVPPSQKVVDLIKLITESEIYEEDFVKDRLEVIAAEREERKQQLEEEKRAEREERRLEAEREEKRAEREERRLEAEREERRIEAEREERKSEKILEEKKLEMEYELRKLELQGNLKNGSDNSAVTGSGKQPDLFKSMIHFDGKSDISIYLALFERQIARMNIIKDNWVAYLLNLLPLDIVNTITREPDTVANDYDHVKNLLLKRFKMSPEEFRQKLLSHKKDPSANWRDLAFELRNYLEEWVNGMGVNDFEALKELMLVDQIKRRLPREMKEHFIDELQNIKNVDILVNKLDNYEAARRNVAEINSNPYDVEDRRHKMRDSYDNSRKKWFTVNPTSTTETYNSNKRNKSQIKCFKCNGQGHVASQCNNGSNSQINSFSQHTSQNDRSQSARFLDQRESNCAVAISKNSNNMSRILDINGEKMQILFDTGSDINLASRKCYITLGSPRLLPNDVSVHGIGEKVVQPEGYFQYDFSIDGFPISANLYVVPSLRYDMVLGSDIIKKFNLAISKNGIQIISKSDDCQIGYITIVGNSTKKLNDAASFNNERKTLITNSSRDENVNDIVLNENSIRNNFLVNLASVIDDDEIDLNHVNDLKIRNEIKELVKIYKPNKSKDTGLRMSIILSDEIPICQRPRRFPLNEQEVIENQIEQWLRDGIIRPSSSDFAAPVVLVKKKDDSYRLCIDYRKLNRKIIKDRFPLPLIEDVLDKLEKSKVFTTLDLKNGFFHVEIEEKSRKYTAFVTHEGEYEFLKCPFGLCISANQFQRYVSTVFRELLRDGTIVLCMDDFVIPSQTEEEGLQKLKRVLKVAEDYGLEFNFKKCKFLQRRIEFLGYIIENGIIQPSETKTLAVRNFPQPKTVKQVQSYLGLTGYFRKFIPNYARIAKPLSDLLRKNVVFKFGPEQTEAFEKLKEILSQKPVLHLFKQGSTLELHTDASSHGFGAVLLQKADDEKFHPIQYMSKKTTPQQEKYCSYELEVLAIIEALKKFRNYLLGTKFKIVTDCAAFQKTLDKKELTPRVARWALFIEEFEYEIVHRAGNKMKHVDALSRNTVLIITRSQSEMTTRIASAQERDELVKTIKSLVEKGEENEYLIKNNVLYKFENGRDLLVVPEEMQKEIIRKTHDKGHFAIAKTEELVKQEFFIPRLGKQVEAVISNCIECILHNKKRGKTEGFLNPIPKESIPLNTYHVDHIGPLPSTNKNYQFIFTVVDAFTKFTWFYPVKTTSAQEVIEKLKLQQTIFGNPDRIITDRGPAFKAKDFDEYCSEEGIEHVKITTGMPRGNGQIERIHNILIPVLAKLCQNESTKWYKHVAKVQRVINSTVTRSTRYTPFELLIGVKMKNKDDMKIKEMLEEEHVNCRMMERDDIREEARKNILKIQEENRKQFNKKRKEPNKYELNDLVAIQRTQYGTGLKLREKFHGPYRVTAVKACDRYNVEKVGDHEGPIKTSTSAEYMKPWTGR